MQMFLAMIVLKFRSVYECGHRGDSSGSCQFALVSLLRVCTFATDDKKPVCHSTVEKPSLCSGSEEDGVDVDLPF